MKKINLLVMAIALIFMISCSSESSKTDNKTEEVKKEVEKKVEEVKKEEAKKEEADPNAIGVGPIKELKIAEAVDNAMADKGKELFKSKGCIACHKMNKRKVGPALTGVTKRQRPEWIMNMILNPTEMVKKDPTAMALLAEYSAPMSDQHLTEEEARAVLEFFRQNDTK